MDVKSFINKLLVNYRYNGARRGYTILYKQILNRNSLKICDLKMGGGIKDWKSKWYKYDKKLTPLSYQIFSRYIGEDVNIIPLEILAGIVEPVLTPEPFRAQYGDKNNLEQLFHGIRMPATLVRNIEGVYYDRNYNPVTNPLDFVYDNQFGRIILKPTREQSGRGVKMFSYKNGQYADNEGNVLNLEYLDKVYKRNFIIQEALSQSPYMKQFNPTSINTLRVATYRSVKTGEVHVINSVMRIGASGQNVDNAHSGGKFIGIDIKDGTVGKYVCDWLGKKETVFNDIDFSKASFRIPDWEKVCEFAKQVSERILFGNLVALDIAIDDQGNPTLIEANVGGFSGWFFQFTTGSVFGEFTDEVMECCWKQYRSIKCELTLNN